MNLKNLLKEKMEVSKLRTFRQNDFFSMESLHSLIEDAIDLGASDIHINGDNYIRFEVHGRFFRVSGHTLDALEVISLVNNLYKSDTGSDMVLAGENLNHEYEYRYKKKGSDLVKSYNFRVNTTAATVFGRPCPTVTIRQLNEEPPIWGDMGYGESLWDIWRPDNGLVVVSGATGTGKSTLLASGSRRILEERSNEKIVTLESPIEYILHPYQSESTLVVQRSVPKNCRTFVEGVEEALRQHPTIVVVGEARKREEIEAALLVCVTGHLTYTTTHTNSVPETGHRLLNEFPIEEQRSRLGDIIYSSRLFVNQRLLPSTDGKRVAIREILPFDRDVLNHLEKVDPVNLKSEMRKMVGEYGQSFGEHASHFLRQGLLEQNQVDSILLSEKSEIK
ncbi:ATPase, T2SS/T4P/T4SS family [Vibrio parahaemolyticus]|uniref:ATPase, T2SS/T4P/T4SS family n=1 Tax=Vibrio parahaemolyticus TaxID=670 RepID=A0AAW8PXI1_VIBPH|nr:ATPase, T2SS/T4P/T4SS family [Vibrio parahaemolyticus]MDS1820931.1 ATPase, T2SS/T4P/T4SS family [Vibrio parahaemolyticus]